MEVVNVQMTDMAQTWWLAKEELLEKPITWERFSKSFYERFFPKNARREMEQQFINLRQGSQMVDEYTIEFLRLSSLAPYMVAEEKDRANRFQQRLRLDIQKFLVTQQLRTYSHVRDTARCLEHVMKKENRSRL